MEMPLQNAKQQPLQTSSSGSSIQPEEKCSLRRMARSAAGHDEQMTQASSETCSSIYCSTKRLGSNALPKSWSDRSTPTLPIKDTQAFRAGGVRSLSVPVIGDAPPISILAVEFLWRRCGDLHSLGCCNCLSASCSNWSGRTLDGHHEE